MRPKSSAEIAVMREGGKRLAKILNSLAKEVKVGITGQQISAKAAQLIKDNKMQPVVLGYDGFPDVLCISVNQTIVHGIPTEQPFKDGDVIKLDLTLGYQSLIVDSATTVVVGQPSPEVKRLLEGTKRALEAGIDAIKGEGTRIGDISSAIEDVLDSYKLGVIRELVGHGIGDKIHEPPNIPNYGARGGGPVLKAGMTIAIEPMASLGEWRVSFTKNGNVDMADGSIGAHFEHTVLITQDGFEILTQL